MYVSTFIQFVNTLRSGEGVMTPMFSLLIDFLNLFVFLPFIKVNEEDIGKNMRSLNKQSWFQQLLTNDKFRNLIVYDREIREFIGKCKANKLNKDKYTAMFHRKLHKLLVKKTTSTA